MAEPRGTVQQGVFADQKATDGPKVKQTAAVSNTNPVEILYRPKPNYTDEGRAKRIEGEVLVQVVFHASGDVQVERVVRGLGYGLDESANCGSAPDKVQAGDTERSAGGFSGRGTHYIRVGVLVGD